VTGISLRQRGGISLRDISMTDTVNPKTTTEQQHSLVTSPLKNYSGCSHIGALYFLNGRGDILIQRLYRDDIDQNIAVSFRTHVLMGGSRDGEVAPVRILGGNAVLYYRAADVYLLAITKSNSNCMMVFQFLAGLVELIKSYCNGQFHEEVVKGNFVLIYELLDDTLDYGYPQLTDPAMAKSFIYQKGWATEKMKRRRQAAAQSSTLQVTGAVGWRKDGSIKYKKNEVYLDIVEHISALMSPQGAVLRADVHGTLMMKTFLTGMPEIKVGLNDRIDDVTFHPCVNLGRYNAEKVISFIPPDGEFELAKYRVTEGIELPFKATALMTEQGRTRMDVTVKVRSSFDPKLSSVNNVILIPVPPQTARAQFQLSVGKAKYDPKRGALVWKIKKFPGTTEHTLAANIELISTARERHAWSRPPMSLNFQIPMQNVSGIQVQYLTVWEKSGYKVDKWVRKSCKSLQGDYQIRFS
jgi:AP-2 complex subunit mu-1